MRPFDNRPPVNYKRRSNEDFRREQEERASNARRGGEKAPSVAGALMGKPSAEEVQKWTTFLPKAPPGVRR